MEEMIIDEARHTSKLTKFFFINDCTNEQTVNQRTL